MNYKMPNYKTFNGRKLTSKLITEVTSHSIHNNIEYIDIFFTVERSAELVVSRVNKIVVENIIIGKNKYKVVLKLQLPKQISFSERLPIISIQFNRKTKKHRTFVVGDTEEKLEVLSNVTLVIYP